MATTAKWGLHYPVGGDAPDVPLWMEDLATDLDDVAKYTSGLLSARPAAGTSGRFYYATDDTTTGPTGTLFVDNGTTWLSVGNQSVPRVRVTNTIAQSIPNTTATAITFDTETFDTGTPSNNMHDTGSNTSRLTCRVAGPYRITFLIPFTTSGAGSRQVAVKLNGTTFIPGGRVDISNFASGHIAASHTITYPLVVNDYVEVIAYQNTGGALNTGVDVSATFGDERPVFEMQFISP